MNHWTKNKPTVPGHYWMLANEKARVVEIIERNGDLCFEHGAFFLSLTYFDGVALWCGPLPLPTHSGKEVIVLRDADGLERMEHVDYEYAAGSFMTSSHRLFHYAHQRTAQGLRIFTELKN